MASLGTFKVENSWHNVSMPELQRIAPELPVSDLGKSLAYYEAKLGFRTVMTMQDGDYAVVERDNVAIHLYRADKDTARGSIHIFTEGLDDLHKEFEGRGAKIHQDIARKPWGNRDFRVIDDSGNELKFTEPSP
jgi:predicted enzyme related to lactoylglutathione lyase